MHVYGCVICLCEGGGREESYLYWTFIKWALWISTR